MKIKIRNNAKSIYLSTINCRGGVVDWDWAYLLEVLQGEVLDVETEYLFVDQFNTAPVAPKRADELVDCLSSHRSQQTRDYVRKVLGGSGMRIMAQSVSEVIDDVRPGKMRCQWCGHCSNEAEACPKCSKSDYLYQFPVSA